MDTSDLVRPLFFPRGVASQDAGIGCTTHAGTVYGLELQTGRLRWQTLAARRPLLIHANRLFAAELAAGQPNIISVRSFDLEDPDRDQRPASDIAFPPWVDVADGDTFAFEVYALGSDLVIEWRARRRYRGGAPPPAAILNAPPQEVAGTARVHLVTGAVEVTSNGCHTEATHRADSLTTIAFRMGSIQHEEPWRCNEYRCALTRTEHMGKQWLVLRRQEPDGNVTEAELCPVDTEVVPRVTRDGSFVLVWTTQSDLEPRPDGPGCMVFRIDTDSPVATVALDPEAEDPCVLQPYLYSIASKTLIAMDLDRREQAWIWPFPSTKSKGPPQLRK